VAGTVTALFVLVTFTLMPPLAAVAFRVNVQSSVADPVIDPWAQLSPVSIGTPTPLRATDADDPFEALLVIDNWPVADPDAEGANWTVSVTLAFGATVSGRLFPPLIEKSAPVRSTFEIWTAPDPWFDTVTLPLAVLLTATWPKSIVVDERVSVPATADLFKTSDPPQPVTAKLHEKVSSPIKPI